MGAIGRHLGTIPRSRQILRENGSISGEWVPLGRKSLAEMPVGNRQKGAAASDTVRPMESARAQNAVGNREKRNPGGHFASATRLAQLTGP